MCVHAPYQPTTDHLLNENRRPHAVKMGLLLLVKPTCQILLCSWPSPTCSFQHRRLRIRPSLARFRCRQMDIMDFQHPMSDTKGLLRLIIK